MRVCVCVCVIIRESNYTVIRGEKKSLANNNARIPHLNPFARTTPFKTSPPIHRTNVSHTRRKNSSIIFFFFLWAIFFFFFFTLLRAKARNAFSIQLHKRQRKRTDLIYYYTLFLWLFRSLFHRSLSLRRRWLENENRVVIVVNMTNGGVRYARVCRYTVYKARRSQIK